MNKFGNRLKTLRENHDLTQDELGKKLNLTKQAISNYENGRRVPDCVTLELIADFFNVNLRYLMGREERRKELIAIPSTKIPLLGTIAAGHPILAEQHIEEYIDLESFTKADFCLRVKGDSMIGASIVDGDIVFIRMQDDVEDGEIAAVLIEDTATLKRVFKLGNFVQLRSENPNVKPIILNGNKEVKILGKAVYRLTSV